LTSIGILKTTAGDDEDDDNDPSTPGWVRMCPYSAVVTAFSDSSSRFDSVSLNKDYAHKSTSTKATDDTKKAHVTNACCNTIMMKAFPQQMLLLATTALLLMASRPTTGFAPSTTTRTRSPATVTTTTTTTTLSAYVPDGLTASQYQKIKAQDRQKLEGKDLARLGPRGFKSRSMQAWQEAYEKGQAKHAFAPFGYREQLQKGQLKLKDVPYMVRPNGSWDNSDVAGAKRAKWTNRDREYARGGYKKEQSASILGSGPGFDWTGTRSRDENLRNKFVPGLS
jgi:hypothetical protein